MLPVKGTDAIVPLGTFCFTANILIRLGVRRQAYPFDFTFQKIDDLAYLLGTDFIDLFDQRYLYPCIVKSTCVTTGHLRYGHIFRHHDLFDASVMEKMSRRLDRLRQSLGRGCVAITTVNEAHGDDLLSGESAQKKSAVLKISKLLSALLMYNHSNSLVLIQLRYGPRSEVKTIIRKPHLSVIDVATPLGSNARNGDVNVQDGSRLFCQRSQVMLEASLLQEINLLLRTESGALDFDQAPVARQES